MTLSAQSETISHAATLRVATAIACLPSRSEGDGTVKVGPPVAWKVRGAGPAGNPLQFPEIVKGGRSFTIEGCWLRNSDVYHI